MMEHEAMTGSSNMLITVTLWGSIIIGLVLCAIYAVKYNEK